MIKTSLLCSTASYFIPRACTYICAHSHPEINSHDYFLNSYLPKWLIQVCHSEKAYYDLTNSTSEFEVLSGWKKSLYDSLWITALFSGAILQDVGYLRGIPLIGFFTVSVEWVRVEILENKFTIPHFFRTSFPNNYYAEGGRLRTMRNIMDGSCDQIIQTALIMMIDMFFIIYFPFVRAFSLPPSRIAQTQYPELFANNDIDLCFEEVVTNNDENDPITLEKIKEPVRLKACGHTFEKSSIRNWLHINPTCPLCRKNVLLTN